MIAVTSIEQLRNVVGSKDQALFDLLLKLNTDELENAYGPRNQLDEEVLEEFEEELNETVSNLKLMLLSSKPPTAEPGAWIYLIKQIIEAKQLAVKLVFSFNKGYKHLYAWEPYREAFATRLSKSAVEALQHLENGRPLRGKRLEYDGCIFAWLTQSEIAALHESLSKFSAAEVGNCDLEEFHEDVVEALAMLKQEKCDLVLSAH